MFKPEDVEEYPKRFDAYTNAVLENIAKDSWRKLIRESKRQNKALKEYKKFIKTLYETEAKTPDVEMYEVEVGNMVALFEREFLKNAFCRLRKKFREVIFLSFFLELSSDEIASIMKLKKDVVYVYKSKALRRLEKLIREELDEKGK